MNASASASASIDARTTRDPLDLPDLIDPVDLLDPNDPALMISSAPYEIGSFCSASAAPPGSVTMASVPFRRSGDGCRITLPPSDFALSAAAVGSATRKYGSQFG